MTSNLDNQIQLFEQKVKEVRNDLNKYKDTGYLSDEFDNKLEQLNLENDSILAKLLPFFRRREEHKKRVTIQATLLTSRIQLKIDASIQQVVQIDLGCYGVLFSDGHLKWLVLEESEDKVRWIELTTDFKEKISYVTLTEGKDLLFMSKTKKSYFYSLADMKIMLADNEMVNPKRVENKEHVELLTNDERMATKKLELIPVEGATCLERVSNDLTGLGTQEGDVFFLHLMDDKARIDQVIPCFESEVKALHVLKIHREKKKLVAVLGRQGNLSLIEKDMTITSIEGLAGGLFDMASNQQTALVLSDNGCVYLLEESLGTWQLNPFATLPKVLFTNIIARDEKSYLAFDSDSNVYGLEVNRLEASDLQQVAIYG